MDATRRFRAAAVAWAAGGAEAGPAEARARELAAGGALSAAVLVEGVSDAAALEALAERHGRDLAADGVAVVPLGGATSIGRFLRLLGPQGLDLRLAGLCDAAEEGYFRRGLERVGAGAGLTREGLAGCGFWVCEADLEDELIRALGADCVQEIVASEGELRSFRTFQKQPAQRERPVEQQLRRFLGTHSGRKEQYGRSLVDGLDLARTPRPLSGLLACV